MIPSHENTLYDVLDTTPDASPQEIRSAYLRAKLTYSKDNPVLYSLITPEDREQTLKKIEEAYFVLSDPDKRRHYDRSHGLIQLIDESPLDSHISGNLTSFLDDQSDENLLIPPTTDIPIASAAVEYPDFRSKNGQSTAPVQPPQSGEPPTEAAVPPTQTSNVSTPSKPPVVPPPFHGKKPSNASSPALEVMLPEALEQEREWRGSFLKKIRESSQISLEEMSEVTKISKTFILAVEAEDFAKLPAAVFARGFVSQIARVLKLPQEKVASAFMSRYHAARNIK